MKDLAIWFCQRAIIQELLKKYPSIRITVFLSKNIFLLKEYFENKIKYYKFHRTCSQSKIMMAH